MDEPFIVKHYVGDDRPSIKGNGFDGLEVGEDRQYAEEFIAWVNARLARLAEAQAKIDALMLEYCPDEMTPEQTENWAAHQRPTDSASVEQKKMTFEAELESLINSHSMENASNTPDWILAQLMASCLSAWNTGVQQRETWYGRDARPSETKNADVGSNA